MGRKDVPQPLTLADPAAPSNDSRAFETASATSPPDANSPRFRQSPYQFSQKKSQQPGTTTTSGRQASGPSEVLPQRRREREPIEDGNEELDEPDLPELLATASAYRPPFEQQRAVWNPPAPKKTAKNNEQKPVNYERDAGQNSTGYDGGSTNNNRVGNGNNYNNGDGNYYNGNGQAPPQSRGHTRQPEEKASKSGFFNFNKSSKSSSDRPGALHQHMDSRSETKSRDSDRAAMTKQPSDNNNHNKPLDHGLQKPLMSLPTKSDSSLASSIDHDPAGNSKKSKPKGFSLMNRGRSSKETDSPSPKDAPPSLTNPPLPPRITEPEKAYGGAPLRTAPLHAQDRSFREMMSSAVRHHSAERSQQQQREVSGSKGRDNDRDMGRHQPPPPKENGGGGSTFFSSLKNSSNKAADILSKGLFGKGGRSGSTSEREPTVDDEHYVLKLLNLPLVEQTRRTRISKRLEESRDKTEFWMPAFPWRAIDYLNYKGSEVEGLYRVPGSGPQIKKWQRKFDEAGDVNLFEQPDLYDINIIGSMLKAWLRELPDELFPKVAQDRIARECAGSEKVPPLLIEELSNLAPYNYYLLFAITCHLSLLLDRSEKNKMDFRNLCICFQPCMKIDVFCFRFLVCNWKECWKGCKNENKYIEQEYALFRQPPPRVASTSPGNGDRDAAEKKDKEVPEETPDAEDEEEPSQLTEKPPRAPAENGNVETTSILSSALSSTLTMESEQEPEQERVREPERARNQERAREQERTWEQDRNRDQEYNQGQERNREQGRNRERDANRGRDNTPPRPPHLRQLSPIKPLSPLGF